MKEVLIVYYSQTGQITSVVDSIRAQLQSDENVNVTLECLRPEKDYPFPWPIFQFLDAFPESVYLDPPPIKPLSISADQDFDLIVIAYQVWFLSPSLPITAFIKSAQGQRLLNGKPVITVIACRNMWLMAQEKMKQLLRDAGARLLDNVALVDSQSALVTFITTPRWVLTGNKGKPGGLLPPAGVSQQDIDCAGRFGKAIAAALATDRETLDQPILQGLSAVKVDTRLIASEKIGHRSFMIWGKLLRKIGPPGHPLRRVVLAVYALFLISMIITVVPINMLVNFVLRSIFVRRVERERQYYEAPSGSASDRMREFDYES